MVFQCVWSPLSSQQSITDSATAGTRKLFKMMLGTDSEFVNKFFAARKYWDINVGQWIASGQTYIHKVLVHQCCVVVSPLGAAVAGQLGCEPSELDQAS